MISFKKIFPIIILIIYIINLLFLNKYLLKILTENQLKWLKRISFFIVIFALVYSLICIFEASNIFGVYKKDLGWAVEYIEYSKIHKYSTGKTQKIALIDSGISKFQIEKNRQEAHISLIGDNNDNNGHGTMMYSIIKGYNKEIYGIAPDTEILSIKIMDNNEKIKPSLVVEAINLAIDKKCTIINLSIGSYNFNQDVSDSIKRALNKGITVIASAGDYSNNDMLFPASEPGVISVGSLSANGKVSDFTNASSECIIIAPGDEIRTINNKGEIIDSSGTSQATALISGYIALLKDYAMQKNIQLDNKQIINILNDINNKKIKYIDPFLQIK